MAWAHVLQQQSAMGNPFEFREAMKAAFGFSEKTLEEVLKEQEQRHTEESKQRGRKRSTKAPTVTAQPKQSEIDKLNALLSPAKPRSETTDE